MQQKMSPFVLSKSVNCTLLPSSGVIKPLAREGRGNEKESGIANVMAQITQPQITQLQVNFHRKNSETLTLIKLPKEKNVCALVFTVLKSFQKKKKKA